MKIPKPGKSKRVTVLEVKVPKGVKTQETSYWTGRAITDKHRDWGYGEENWVKDYNKSVDHPHRQLIVQLLKTFPWSYLMEVGCNTGPNLKVIRDAFPEKALYGVDVNEDSVAEAKRFLDSSTDVRVMDVRDFRAAPGQFDVILADAVLMYVNPQEIRDVMKKIADASKRAVMIVDRYAPSPEGRSTGYIWERDYAPHLKAHGFNVTTVDMTHELWPTSENWAKYGRIWLGTR